ncbi:MAG: methionyl-tRNA formyltransferase [Patescibacteria group bacterium]
MNIIFFGTPEFSVPFLKALITEGRAPGLVVSQPDRPAGRKALIQLTPVKRAVLDLGLATAQPENVNDSRFIEELKSLHADLFVVVAFGQILSRALLDIPRLGTVNVHPSFLPKYRGAAPLQEAILHGDTETGVTIMLMDEKMDHGPILLQEIVALAADETLSSLQTKTTTVGVPLLLKAIDQLEAGTAQPVPQNDSLATITRLLTKDSGRLDFSQSAESLDRRVRALTPWPGAWFEWRGLRIKILTAHIGNSSLSKIGEPIARASELVIPCADGSLIVDLIQPAGKKPMRAPAFINGYLSQSDSKKR